jgi:hypothetical protein
VSGLNFGISGWEKHPPKSPFQRGTFTPKSPFPKDFFFTKGKNILLYFLKKIAIF